MSYSKINKITVSSVFLFLETHLSSNSSSQNSTFTEVCFDHIVNWLDPSNKDSEQNVRSESVGDDVKSVSSTNSSLIQDSVSSNPILNMRKKIRTNISLIQKSVVSNPILNVRGKIATPLSTYQNLLQKLKDFYYNLTNSFYYYEIIELSNLMNTLPSLQSNSLLILLEKLSEKYELAEYNLKQFEEYCKDAYCDYNAAVDLQKKSKRFTPKSLYNKLFKKKKQSEVITIPADVLEVENKWRTQLNNQFHTLDGINELVNTVHTLTDVIERNKYLFQVKVWPPRLIALLEQKYDFQKCLLEMELQEENAREVDIDIPSLEWNIFLTQQYEIYCKVSGWNFSELKTICDV